MDVMSIDRNHVRALARRYFRDSSDVEDVVQEVLMRAFIGRDSWNGRGLLMSWVYVIVKNVALELLRKRTKYAKDLDYPASQTLNPTGQMNARHDLAVAIAAVDAMGPKCSEAFKLRFVQEYTEGEVAKLLGVPVATANARAYRARAVALAAVNA